MQKLSVRCGECRRTVRFEDRHLGRRVKCPGCGSQLHLQAETPASVIEDPFAEDSISDDVESIQSKQKGSLRESQPVALEKPLMKNPPLDQSGEVDQAQKPRRRRKESGASEASNLQASLNPPQPLQAETPDVESASLSPFNSDAEASDAEASAIPADEYFDEFGLSELTQETQAWDQPASLPPVAKKFVKKPKRLPQVEASEVVSSTSSVRPAPSRPRPLSQFKSSDETGRSRWAIYLLFMLTLLPLCYNVLIASQDSIEDRFREIDPDELNAEAADDGEADPANGVQPQEAPEEWVDQPAMDIDDPEQLFNHLPGHRIPGAFLARDTSMHWLFAAISGAVYLLLFLALFRKFSAALGGAVVAAFFTATVGIILLIGLQYAAVFSQSFWIRGRSIIVVFFYLVKLIGYSYRCAVEDGNGFLTSFMGFTVGVGICEEICKILPVIVFLGTAKSSTWQGTCLVGLASGVGFGVAEGIMYSSQYYNGVSTGDIYVVRFVSCVALHSVWSGAGAVLLYFNQDVLHGDFDLGDIAKTLLVTLGISVILHGLYNTLLKQHFPVWALIIGAISIAWLIFIVEKQSANELAA